MSSLHPTGSLPTGSLGSPIRARPDMSVNAHVGETRDGRFGRRGVRSQPLVMVDAFPVRGTCADRIVGWTVEEPPTGALPTGYSKGWVSIRAAGGFHK